MKRWWIGYRSRPGLPVGDTEEFWSYIELELAQKFALLSGKKMMDRLISVHVDWCPNR